LVGGRASPNLCAGGADVKSIDSIYVVIGATWLLVGMVLGLIMGATHSFQYQPLHAHINLVGFACHCIFGLVYRYWPAMKSSRLAPMQFWIFVVSTPVMLVGLTIIINGGAELLTILGSIGVLAGAALFCLIVWAARLADQAA
jgi:hypothetical protein